MIDSIKELTDGHVQRPWILHAPLTCLGYGIMGRFVWTIAIRVFMKERVNMWGNCHHNCHLCYSVFYGRDAERASSTIRFRNFHKLDCFWKITSRAHTIPYL